MRLKERNLWLLLQPQKYYMGKVIWPPKTQIVYIPAHAKGNPDHPDCEFGFITSQNDEFIFCRFWMKKGLSYDKCELRTKANSEACRPEDIMLYRKVGEHVVDAAWEKYVKNPK